MAVNYERKDRREPGEKTRVVDLLASNESRKASGLEGGGMLAGGLE